MESQIRSLDDLGPRICILGPSNSGKSTLANAIARSSPREVIHLDQLRFLPNTDWVMRPDEEFFALHDEAIKGAWWIAEGNYRKCFPQRLERATGIILLQAPLLTSLWRYLRRSWFEKDRIGALEGSQDSVKWEMIRFITINGPRTRPIFEEIFENCTLPKVKLSSQQDMDSFYQSMKLRRLGHE